ncbi:MAG TPA: class I SAM-dependent methyltransferase, partial [Chloroflexia bacterium]|nr:class I SAM-dependent methyltransferase [Chloroflexia bacterium]
GTAPNSLSAGRDAQFARFYQLEYKDFTDDVDFYVQYALALDPEKALPVLELGCGTGRIVCALAHAGFQVTGIDSSEAMLDVAKTEIERQGLGAKASLVAGDMRRIGPVGGPFNLAFCALNTFSYLASTGEQLAMLQGIHPLLVQHGVLILDLTPPYDHLLPPSDGEVVHQGSFADEVSGGMVHKFVTGRANRAAQSHEVTLIYDVEAADGTLARVSRCDTMRWTSRYEMPLLLEAAGYRVDKLYGSYDLDDFADESERMIFVART